jgi:tetratricopeptide (TPR) repeat protein
LAAGLRAAERARDLTAAASPREQKYAATVLAYFGGGPRPHESRMTDHENAMAALRLAHPEDMEAVIFHARAIVANAPPTDLTFARQLAGAAMMLPLFQQYPDHPGLAHYIIHAYDAPALADQGVNAAIAYAGIAPAAPHALHMPSHIFTRLGYWEESIVTNERSAAAEPVPDAAVHPMDYMVYAYLQLGRDGAAKEVLDRAILNPDRFYGGTLGYNFAAMPARFALERNDWAAASSLRVPVGALAHVEALSRFTRAIGLARGGGDPTAEIAALAILEDSLRRQNDTYWTTIVRAQRLAAQSWSARAAGDAASALALAIEAAELEETVEKHPVTPGPLLPARELLGDLLMEMGRHGEALAAYEATLKREPNRARTLYGAARAAEGAGARERARTHYSALLELMSEADAARPEPAAARRYLN